MLVAALVPIVVAVVAFAGYALWDLHRSRVKALPKWLWAVIILLSMPTGAIIYFLVGRETA